MALTSGLISQYGFDGDISDSVGSFSGTSQGVVFASDEGGSYLEQDWTDDPDSWAELPNSLSIGANGQYTISAWIKPDPHREQVIITDYNVSYPGLLISVDAAQVVCVRHYPANAPGYEDVRATGTLITPDVWQMVTVTWDGSQVSIYIDGNLAGSGAVSAAPWASSNGYRIASSTAPNENIPCMADLRIWNRELSGSETLTMFSQGRGYIAPAVFTRVLGRSEILSYAHPNPNHGWALLLNNGQVYSSPTGIEGSWSSQSIPSYAADASQVVAYPGYLHRVAGFWLTLKPKGVLAGDGQQLAWANALDGGGNATLPASWNTMAPFAGGTVASVHPDKTRNVSILTRFVTETDGSWSNSVWVSNQAASSTDTPVWTQVNGGNSILPHFRVVASASNSTTLVIVSQSWNDQTTVQQIHYWDHGPSVDYTSDTWNLVASNTNPWGMEGIQKPCYSEDLGKWFAGYDSGVLVSSDGAANWTAAPLIHEGQAVQIYDVAVGPSGTVVAVGTVKVYPGAVDTGIIFRSEDQGATWMSVASNPDILTSVDASSKGIFLVGGENGVLGTSTTDGWQFSNVGDIEDDLQSPHDPNPNVAGLVYAGN